MKYEQKTKHPKDEVDDKLHELCIAEIGEEYRVLWQSDDGGNHVCVYFEEEVPEKAKQVLSSPFMGWRLIKVIVPTGYLAVFYPLNEKK
jgi:hypothetical protein